MIHIRVFQRHSVATLQSTFIQLYLSLNLVVFILPRNELVTNNAVTKVIKRWNLVRCVWLLQLVIVVLVSSFPFSLLAAPTLTGGGRKRHFFLTLFRSFIFYD